MKTKIAWIGLALILAGCGANKKALRQVDELLEKSKGTDCETIRRYLDTIHEEVKRQLK